uniref:leucine-rich repeat and IQ domain-containing protein 1-like n=1 Tax=Styela clava TaxID=7725 RepID=UPI0019396905|nr:leucine-rich repeat and IQ domain-containing protein 1-like [Styela clava]
MDDASIEEDIQKELDAISLSSLNSDEEDIHEEDQIVQKSYDYDSVGLFLEKSSQRHQIAHDILKEATDILTVCDHVGKSLVLSEEISENEENQEEDFPSSYILTYRDNNEISTKSTNEIEEENRVKLEELEDILKVKEEDEILQLEKKRISEEENLNRWVENEEKMKKNIEVMVDKENYWEKTYGQVAKEEIFKKESELEKEFLESQQRIQIMQQEEKKILENLLKEKEELDSEKKRSSAICIQAIFRGYKVRKIYWNELQTRILQSKERRRHERIAKMEEARAKEKARQEEEKRKMNEKKRRNEKMKENLIENKNLTKTTSNSEQVSLLPSTGIKSNATQEPDSMKYKNKENKLSDAEIEFNETVNQENKSMESLSTSTSENTDTRNKNRSSALESVAHETALDTVSNEGKVNDKVSNGNIQNDSSSSALKNSAQETTINAVFIEDNSNDGCNADTSNAILSNSVTNEIEEVSQGIPVESETDKMILDKPKNEEIQLSTDNIITGNVLNREIEFVNEDSRSVENEMTSSPGNKEIQVSLKVETNSGASDHTVVAQKDVAQNIMESLSLNDPNLQQNDSFDGVVEPEPAAQTRNEVVEEDIIKQDSNQNVTTNQAPNSGSQSRGESESLVKKCSNAPEKDDKLIPERDFELINKNEMILTGLNKNQDSDDICVTEKNIENHPRSTLQLKEEKSVSFERTQDTSLSSSFESTQDINLPPINSESAKIEETISSSPVSELKNDSHPAEDTCPTVQTFENTYSKTTELDNGDISNTGIFSLSTKPTNIIVEKNKNILREKQTDSTKPESTNLDNSVPSSNSHFKKEKIENNMDENCSYSEKLELRRNAWLKKFSLKGKREHKSPSTLSKRRRLIRISSAAKRLPPFSQEEIFNGSYQTTECRINKKALSFEQIKCVFLTGIQEGRNLSSVSNCAYLTHLTVQNCGLLSLENMQSCPCLKFIDVSHNSINMISCNGMKQLQYLDVSCNRLTSIHGVDGCHGLLYFNLSHNNITKISGLDDVINLLNLRICNNQLINISGLCCCENLLYLDISENHLTNLDDLEDCKLLLSVIASGNNLERLGQRFLGNMVLLSRLDVSRNSLQDLDLTENTWLPFLTDLDASINRIGSSQDSDLQADFSIVMPFLSNLNLSKNLISNAKELTSLMKCKCINKVDLTDNPLSSDDTENDFRFIPEIVTKSECTKQHLLESTQFYKLLQMFCPLDNFGKTFAYMTHQKSEILTQHDSANNVIEIVSKQLEELQSEVKKYSSEIQRTLIRWGNRDEGDSNEKTITPPGIFTNHVEHLKSLQEMSLYFRNVHEHEGFKFVPISTSNTEDNGLPISHTTSRKSLASKKFDSKTKKDCILKSSRIIQNVSSESMQTVSKPEDVNVEESIKLIKQSNGPGDKKLDSNTVKSSNVYGKLKLRTDGSVMENVAAKKIQSFWRGFHVRKRHSNIKKARVKAAIKIQSTWRGYQTRMKIKKAMEMLEQTQMNTARQDDFEEEIDLDGFDFDEKSFDEKWAYKVSGLEDFYPKPQEQISENTAMYFNSPSSHEKTADQPPHYQQREMTYSKPPLPPISSRGSTPLSTRLRLGLDSHEESVTDSNRSKTSAKQELLTNQWGIKSSSTADLMMRRAKRLKGGRKKAQSAEEKLHRFQEKASTFQTSEQISHRRQTPPNKIDYFKAREQGYSMKNLKDAEEEQQKQQYTYEWLHNQVGSNYNPDHKISPPRKLGQPHPPETKRDSFRIFTCHS